MSYERGQPTIRPRLSRYDIPGRRKYFIEHIEPTTDPTSIQMSDTLLIQGDSLPLPRQTVPYDETWPGRLRRESAFTHVVNRSQSGKTTDDLHAEKVRFPNRKLEAYDPEVVVLQIGIVDCAPRLLSKTEKDLITAFPFQRIARVGSHLLKRARGRSRERTYVSEPDFETNLRDFLRRTEAVGVEDVVVIKILTAGEKYTAKNPNVQSAIRAYNEVVDAVVSDFPEAQTMRPLADSETEEAEIVDTHTLDDGYHLDSSGHRRIYDRLTTTSPIATAADVASAADD